MSAGTRGLAVRESLSPSASVLTMAQPVRMSLVELFAVGPHICGRTGVEAQLLSAVILTLVARWPYFVWTVKLTRTISTEDKSFILFTYMFSLYL